MVELLLLPRLMLLLIVPAVIVRSKSPDVVEIVPLVMFPAVLVIDRLPVVELMFPEMVPLVLVMVALLDPEEISEVMVDPFRDRVDSEPKVRVVAVMLFEPVVRVLLAFTATKANELVVPKLLLKEKLSAIVILPSPAEVPFTAPLIVPLFTVKLDPDPKDTVPTIEADPLRVVVALEFRVRLLVRVLVVARFRAPVTEVVVAVIDSLAVNVAPLLIVKEVIAVDAPMIPLVVELDAIIN